ncbi:MAG: tetratricopeptide repeat protein [Pseudorhodoplanes sp.]
MRRLSALLPSRASRDQEMPVVDRMAAAHAASQRQNYKTALAIWGPLAQAGVARAQNNIGACFAEGLGVERDMQLVLRWLTLAAGAGDPVGQRNLAAVYFKGEGVEPDPQRAAELYRAEAGDGPAQDVLSWMLLEGEMVAPDLLVAKRWAEAAAAQGVAASMTRLGMIYHNALGVERDAAAAVKWWDKAAARGDADAQAMLGAAYHLGAGVPRDPVAALAWLVRAQNGGSTLAAPFTQAARSGVGPADADRARKLAELPLPEPVA